MPNTLSEIVPGIIHPRLHRLEERARAMVDGASEEDTHQMRVAARRLAAALDAFRRVIQGPDAARVGPFRRVERRLGALRDLDVLEARVREDREEGGSALHDALAGVLDVLATRRHRARRRAERALARPGFLRARQSLHEWLDRPQFRYTGSLPAGAVIPDLYLPALGEVLVHPGWELGGTPAPDAPGARALHALRRALKALRYRVECLEGWFGPPATAWLEELHAMQDALGEWHDDGVLLEWLAEAGVPATELERVRARACAALGPWEGWRQRYLDPVERSRLRALLQHGGAAPGAGPGAGDSG